MYIMIVFIDYIPTIIVLLFIKIASLPGSGRHL
jgi:hypothetical protein